MADPATEPARVDYRVGAEFDPEGSGRFELTLLADGSATLAHRYRGVHRSWTARVDDVVWPRLVEALRGSGFPAAPPVRSRGAVQELAVTGVEPAGEVWMRRGSGAEVGLADALRILDSVAHQVSGGAVPGEGTLPRIVSGIVAAGGEEPFPAQVAVVGALGPRAVAGIVRVDGGVTVLAASDATVVTELPPTGSPPRGLAIGDLGTGDEPFPVVVTGSDDGLIRLWGADGTPLTRQVRHTGPVTAVTTSMDPAGLRIWTADLAGGLLQRGLEPGGPVLTWPGSPVGITALAWAGTADYRMLVLATDDGRVARRSLDDPAELEVWAAHTGPVDAVAVMGVDDDFLIASGGADRVIRLRGGLTGKPGPDLPGHDATVTGLAFGVIDGRLVLGSCSLDGTVRTWDVDARETLAQWSAGDPWPAGIADARTHGVQRWATGGADGVVRIWDARGGDQVLALEGDSAVLCVATALMPGRTLVAAGHQDGTLRVWDALTGQLLGADRSGTEPVTSVEFGTDGRVAAFVSGTIAGSVRVHNPATAEVGLVLSPHTDQVLSLALAPVGGPDGSRRPVLVSGGADRTVRVWAADTGWPRACLLGHTDLVTAVAVAEVAGRPLIASGGYDRTVRLWDQGGAALWTQELLSIVYAVAIDADLGVVLTGGLDDAVRVFSLAGGRERLATEPVEGPVTSVAVGAWRGLPVVAAAGNGAVLCWTLVRGVAVPLAQPAGPTLAVALSPEGELWAVGAGGVTVVEPSPASPA
jgi:WD40 repeat protein